MARLSSVYRWADCYARAHQGSTTWRLWVHRPVSAPRSAGFSISQLFATTLESRLALLNHLAPEMTQLHSIQLDLAALRVPDSYGVLNACGQLQGLIAGKRNPTHACETSHGYRRL